MPLSVIGKPYDQNFLTYLHKLATGKNVTFHHNCNDSALVSAYRTATCIVLPSVYIDVYGGRTQVPELLGQTLLEGMACGLPAICTSVASMPEIVIDGVTGFIVPPRDPRALSEKIAWLRDHPERARIMGQAARDRVLAKFTWPRVVTRCLQIYRS
jgi:glycosyltransferase involved in cell wall biosynthesis